MHIESFKTLWGSQVAPYLQKRVIKRIENDDTADSIIEEELKDIFDNPEEANEVYNHCEQLYQNSK